MNRKSFLKNTIASLFGMTATPVLLTACNDDEPLDPNACEVSPTETAGPFPNKTPAQLIKENIVGNRLGVPMMIKVQILDVNNNCMPYEGAIVDVWHCDAQGNYSQYNGQLDGNFTAENFLRGRQTTDENGDVSFLSIYPGWYPGRAPHIHFEIFDADGQSLLTTQSAFPNEISASVYAATDYNGKYDTANEEDAFFEDSLALNLATSVTGDNENGYAVNVVIRV